MKPRIFHVDAFTKTPLRGNSAGVVLDADGLSAQQMQSMARELRHSETAFVLRSDAPDCDIRVRYFTPTTEVPICGHATIATHYARALHLNLGTTLVHQQSLAGRHAVRVLSVDGDYRIAMEQGPVQFEPPLDAALRREIAAALGLAVSDLEATLPVQVVSTGHSKVMLPLRSSVDLDAIEPDHAALSALSARIGCNGFFPFQLRADQHASDGRMFAPAIGIPEDPVTGNANGPLGAYIVRHSLLPHDGQQLRLRGHQGRRLGRDGVVDVCVDIVRQEPVRVVITGDAVVLFSAELAVELGP